MKKAGARGRNEESSWEEWTIRSIFISGPWASTQQTFSEAKKLQLE